MILALDTATRLLGLALLDGPSVLAELHLPTGGPGSSAPPVTQRLTPSVHGLLADLDLTPTAITALAVATGPGTFNGLRAGLAWAKGFALAHGAALVGIPTLHILAHSQPPTAADLVCVLQAGRGRIAAQPFLWADDHWSAQPPYGITTWADLLANLTQPTTIAGEIDPAGYAALMPIADRGIVAAPPHRNLRRPSALAQLAALRLALTPPDDPATLAPDYWHQPTVTPPGQPTPP